jgi:hypothetical protein
MICKHNTPDDEYCGRCAMMIPKRVESHCKFCGSSEHKSADLQACPKVKKKKGTEDGATGQGAFNWIEPPPYHDWHSTNAAREQPAPVKVPPKPRKKKEVTT